MDEGGLQALREELATLHRVVTWRVVRACAFPLSFSRLGHSSTASAQIHADLGSRSHHPVSPISHQTTALSTACRGANGLALLHWRLPVGPPLLLAAHLNPLKIQSQLLPVCTAAASGGGQVAGRCCRRRVRGGGRRGRIRRRSVLPLTGVKGGDRMATRDGLTALALNIICHDLTKPRCPPDPVPPKCSTCHGPPTIIVQCALSITASTAPTLLSPTLDGAVFLGPQSTAAGGSCRVSQICC